MTLIKAVAQTIPTYTMATFRIPKQVNEDLDSLIGRFCWGSKVGSSRVLALESWRDICQPKGTRWAGGSGCSRSSTQPFQQNWIGESLVGIRGFWCEILRKKCLKGRSFFWPILPPEAAAQFGVESYLLKTALLKGSCFSLGNGLTIDPWHDPWVPGLQDHVPKLKDGEDSGFFSCVASLRSDDGSEWNVPLLQRLILRINWLPNRNDNKLLWKGTSGRGVSVRECYEIALIKTDLTSAILRCGEFYGN